MCSRPCQGAIVLDYPSGCRWIVGHEGRHKAAAAPRGQLDHLSTESYGMTVQTGPNASISCGSGSGRIRRTTAARGDMKAPRLGVAADHLDFVRVAEHDLTGEPRVALHGRPDRLTLIQADQRTHRDLRVGGVSHPYLGEL